MPVPVDHSNDNSIKDLFDQIKSEQQNKLHVLVNNAYAGVDFISRHTGKKFYVADPCEQWDIINGVGLRNHFICTTYASRMMVEQKDGLIVNISSPGGLKYLFNVACRCTYRYITLKMKYIAPEGGLDHMCHCSG